MQLEKFLSNKLDSIKKAQWTRSLREQKPLSSSQREIDGKKIIQFSGNDYLGLSQDPRIVKAAHEAAQAYGLGSTGSRLITGTTPLHTKLEAELSKFKGTDKALFFGSGYAANLGTISALVSPRDVIYCDEFNHSSLLTGAKLSGAEVIEYKHLSLKDLISKVQTTRRNYRNALLVTDSVFSMDGDIAPLKMLSEISKKHDCWLMIDEAHSAGVFGDEGRGLVHKLGLQTDSLIQMGTCSKAFGLEGGYIAGSEKLIKYLIQRAKTFVYSTATSPAIIGGLIKSLEIIQTENWRREQLWSNANKIRHFCLKHDFKIIPGKSQIICIELETNQQALEWSEKLMNAGVWVQAIRPPTVPTARLRITPSALHNLQDLELLFNALMSLKAKELILN
jgi:8-amino-7-oxononanoate synthase